MILILFCCFGVGTFIICSFKLAKNAKQVMEVQEKVRQMQDNKRKGLAGDSLSNIDVDQQYELPAEIDINLFSKKRKLKVN